MNVGEVTSAPSWYVVRTNVRQEDRAALNLTAWGVKTFAPRLKQRRYNEFTGSPVQTAKPLFPRYIFAYFNLNILFHKVRYTRGVNSVVSFGDNPTTVDDDIIRIIQSQTGEDGFIRIGERLKSGDEVLIKGGPLKGFTGIFEREMNEAERVVILLNTINYQARLEVDRELVKKLA